VGYNFEPEWFACGQSPICVEVDRLVKSGVVVVIAAGNTGYGVLTSSRGVTKAGMDLTINDPGNADLAITVTVRVARTIVPDSAIDGAQKAKCLRAGNSQPQWACLCAA
jgi:hypothetical protein